MTTTSDNKQPAAEPQQSPRSTADVLALLSNSTGFEAEYIPVADVLRATIRRTIHRLESFDIGEWDLERAAKAHYNANMNDAWTYRDWQAVVVEELAAAGWKHYPQMPLGTYWYNPARDPSTCEVKWKAYVTEARLRHPNEFQHAGNV